MNSSPNKTSNFEKLLDNYFHITKRSSTVRTEIIGGITAFLTAAYIIFVHPAILSATGMDKGALITVTCLATAFGTLISGFYANAPFIIGPGMGLNAFFTYTLVLGKGVSWEVALGVVFMSGLFFLALTLGGIREKIANAIPKEIVSATSTGIGLFIAFIGLKGMGVITSNPATFVQLGTFSTTTILSIIGFVIMIFCHLKGLNSGILISIIVTSVIGMVIGIVEVPASLMSMPPSIAPIFGKLDIVGALKISLIGPIFSFMFIDMFDSLGFLMACYKNMGFNKTEEGKRGLKKMLQCDVSSTIMGSILGTSTLTSLAESAAGITVGARTGLASIVTGLLFLVALFFSPVVSIVPMYASSPALLMVGVYMFRSIADIDFKDFKTLTISFITIILMPLTYSISIGLSFGFITYILLHAFSKEYEKLNPALLGIGLLSLINLIV